MHDSIMLQVDVHEIKISAVVAMDKSYIQYMPHL